MIKKGRSWLYSASCKIERVSTPLNYELCSSTKTSDNGDFSAIAPVICSSLFICKLTPAPEDQESYVTLRPVARLASDNLGETRIFTAEQKDLFLINGYDLKFRAIHG